MISRSMRAISLLIRRAFSSSGTDKIRNVAIIAHVDHGKYAM